MNSKEQIIVEKIKQRIRAKNRHAKIILFGSHARGDSKTGSDWDVLILLDQPYVSKQVEREYRNELFEVEIDIGEPISTFVYSKNDWESIHKVTPLYRNIKAEGLAL